MLFPGFGSGVVDVAVAVLVWGSAGPDDGFSTFASMVSVSTLPESTSPTVHLPELYVPTEGVTFFTSSPVRLPSGSDTSTPAAVLGPRFWSVTVNVIVSPTWGRGLSTVLVTTRSASCGSVGVLAVLLPSFGS